jgi:hypothetical protein
MQSYRKALTDVDMRVELCILRKSCCGSNVWMGGKIKKNKITSMFLTPDISGSIDLEKELGL